MASQVNLPTWVKSRAMRAYIRAHDLGYTSPLSMQTIAAPTTGAKWVAELSLPPLTLDQMIEIRAAIHALDGRVNYTLFRDITAPPKMGAASTAYDDNTEFDDNTVFEDTDAMIYAEASAAAAAQSRTLSLQGLPANATLIAGTRIAIGQAADTAYQVVEISFLTVASPTGAATVNIAPGIRYALSAGAPISVGPAPLKLRLSSLDAAGFTFGVGTAAPETIAFEEFF